MVEILEGKIMKWIYDNIGFLWRFDLLKFARYPVKVRFTGIYIGKFGVGIIRKIKEEGK